MRVIVVGGGIIGLLSALELLDAGCEVILLERGELAREASWAGGGIVSPLYPWRYDAPVTALSNWAQDYYPALAARLLDETGIDPEYDRCGLLMSQTADVQDAQHWSEQFQRTLVLRDDAWFSDAEPLCASRVRPSDNARGVAQLLRGNAQHGGSGDAPWIHMPEVAAIRNPRLGRALAARLAMHPRFIAYTSQTVESLIHEGARVVGVQTQQQRHLADTVIMACGAWTGRVLASNGVKLPIRPVRGQMLAFQAGEGMLRHIVMCDGTYLIPRRGGLILAGSTLEFCGFDKITTPQAHDWLKARAEAMLPALAGVPVAHHWAGLRPGSPGGIPFIGECAEHPGLFLNAGHYRNGLVLAPAACRLLADLVLQRSPVVAPEPYAPSRVTVAGYDPGPEWSIQD